MDLQQRVLQLERSNRRLRHFGCVGLLVLAVGAAMGLTPVKQRTVEAEQFIVVDQKGKRRAVFGMQDENPKLILLNADGKAVLTVRTFVDGSSAFLIEDSKGTPRVELALIKDDAPVLNFVGGNSATRLRLSGAGPASELILFQQDGKRILEVSKENLKLYDADGKKAVFSAP